MGAQCCKNDNSQQAFEPVVDAQHWSKPGANTHTPKFEDGDGEDAGYRPEDARGEEDSRGGWPNPEPDMDPKDQKSDPPAATPPKATQQQKQAPPPEEDEEPLEPSTKVWNVKLVRTQDCRQTGLFLERAQNFFCIHKDPDKGMALKWNSEHPDEEIRAGDVLTTSNGLGGCGDDVLQEIRDSQVLNLTFKRYVVFYIRVRQEGENWLGLQTEDNHEEHCLEIVEMDFGVVKDWNGNCPAGMEVMLGDNIVQVNGIRGNCQKMSAELRKDAEFEILIQRGM